MVDILCAEMGSLDFISFTNHQLVDHNRVPISSNVKLLLFFAEANGLRPFYPVLFVQENRHVTGAGSDQQNVVVFVAY